MKKILLALYFFLAPVFVYLVWKTVWFNELWSNIAYVTTFIWALTIHRKNQWVSVCIILGAFVVIANALVYTFNFKDIIWIIHVSISTSIIPITFGVSWLYNQYDKPKKNLVTNIFCFQIVGSLVTWVFVTGCIIVLNWILNFFWGYTIIKQIKEDIIVWSSIAGVILGGFIAYYDYRADNKEQNYD